jgi:hypothetical protein
VPTALAPYPNSIFGSKKIQKAVLRIRDILVRIRISVPLTDPDPTSDPAAVPGIFASDLQDDNKKFFFGVLLFEATFTSFLKDKKS